MQSALVRFSGHEPRRPMEPALVQAVWSSLAQTGHHLSNCMAPIHGLVTTRLSTVSHCAGTPCAEYPQGPQSCGSNDAETRGLLLLLSGGEAGAGGRGSCGITGPEPEHRPPPARALPLHQVLPASCPQPARKRSRQCIFAHRGGNHYGINSYKTNHLVDWKEQGNSLVVQWLGLHTSTTENMGSIPGQGTKIP